MTDKPEPEPIQIILKAVHNHIDAVLRDRWCHKALRFTDQGRGRIGQVFGWIAGLHSSGVKEMQDFAVKCANSICENLDYLANYGGMVEGERGITRYIVELGDDGMLNSFTILWYVAVPPDKQADIPEENFRKEFDAKWGPKYRYVFALNGGAIYQGPGSGETFTVSLTPCLWGIHT